jgi:hypothetical protein
MEMNLYPYMNNGATAPMYPVQGQQISPYMMQPNKSQISPYLMQQNQAFPSMMQPNQGYPGMMQQLPQMLQPNANIMYPYMNNMNNPNMMQPFGLGHSGFINNIPDIDEMDLLDNMEDFENVESIEKLKGTDAKGITSNRPAAIISDNAPVPSISLFKELTGYPNYGNPSGNADILYTGNRGVWTFQIPAIISALGNLRAQLIIRGALDDHANVPVDRYSLRITVNGTTIHNRRVSLEHGTPVGRQFTNWRLLTFNITNLRRNNSIVIVNTSNTGENDWIAFDWMEMRFRP